MVGTASEPIDPGFVRNPGPGDDGTWGTEDDDWGDSVLDRDYAIFTAADEIRKKRNRKRLNLPKIKETLDSKKSG